MSNGVMSSVLGEGLARLSDDYQIQFPDDAHERLLQLSALLLKWNKVYNLIAKSTALGVVQRHVLDSLVLCRWLPVRTAITPDKVMQSGSRPITDTQQYADVMDIGSGAGFPVLPLAIVRPDLRFVSIESNGKKTRFQQQVLTTLSLENVLIRNERVEHVIGQAGFITSRAFTAPETFLKIAQSLCCERARVAIMLGQAERMPARLPDGFELEELEPVHIPGIEEQRHVAICRSG